MANICVCATGHAFDDERIYHKQIQALLRAGHKVTYISRSPNIRYIPDNLQHFDLGVKLNIWTRVFSIHFKILDRIKRGDYDFVVIHDPELVFTAQFISKKNKRLVYDIHDDYEKSILSRRIGWRYLRVLISKLWLSLERYTVKNAYAVIFADRATREKFDAGDSLVLGSYPTRDFVKLRNSYEADGPFRIIYVGGISKERGILVALKAFKELNISDVELHLYGNCSDLQLLNAFELDSRVIYHGKLEWQDLIKHLNNADLGLALYQPLPSFVYCPGENAGKMLEYMAAGLPFLISDFPGIRQFCEENRVGILVDPSNPTQVKDKIEEVYNNRISWKKTASNYQQLVLSKYSWEAIEPDFLKIFSPEYPLDSSS